MTMPWGVFSESIYSLWASIALCWGWSAGSIIIFLPLWEARNTIGRLLICKNIDPANTVTVTGAEGTDKTASA